MALEPGNSCWYLTFDSAYAVWQRDADISVKYQAFRPPEVAGEACQPITDGEPYVSGTLVHTDQTEWPYTESNICSYLFVFTNDNAEAEQRL